uniref:Uncharacterized protein n=1 Tax=Arundo donax TaxID=35708 RepID=A0A0A9GY16_ARUDO
MPDFSKLWRVVILYIPLEVWEKAFFRLLM